MCISFFGYNAFPELLWFVAFGRDEFLNRPTRNTHFWDEYPHLLGGRDLVCKGTWFGVTLTGRIAFLTNLRLENSVTADGQAHHAQHPDGHVHHVHSRGDLPLHFLTGTAKPLEFLEGLQGSHYQGFNLVVGDLATGEITYHSNGSGTMPLTLEPGIVYGLSNGLLNQWPKVESGVLAVRNVMAEAGTAERKFPWSDMFDKVLGDSTKLEHLRKPGPVDVDSQREYVCSSRFIEPVRSSAGLYGTRSQIVLAVWRDGSSELHERYLDADVMQWREEHHQFCMSLPAAAPAHAHAQPPQPPAESNQPPVSVVVSHPVSRPVGLQRL